MSKRIFTCLALIAFIGTACTNTDDEIVTQEATETATTLPATETEQPTETATPEPSPTDTEPEGPPTLTLPAPIVDEAAAIAHLTSGQDFIITRIAMKTSTNGWAIGGTRDPGDHILYTRDGGQTWRDVTPPEPASTGGESAKIAHTFFWDANFGWVTYSYEEFRSVPNYPIVWFTSDGGQNWSHSAFLDMRGASMDFYSPEFLRFSDIYSGWLLVTVGAGMSHSYSILYSTTNSGATWERIVEPTQPYGLDNCCKTGMVFYDWKTGLLTSEQGPYVEPFVTWTWDGGLTWELEPLPDPTSDRYLFDNAYCESHSPHIFDSNAIIVGVVCKQFDDDGNATEFNFVYTSLDDGETWESWPADGSGALFFFDEYTGFILGRDIYFTNDGGLTWTLVKTVFWDGQFSFVSRDLGWAVARNDNGEIAFLTTSDGGATWLTIEPVIME